MGENGITDRAVKAGKTQNITGAKEKFELDVADYGAEFYQAKYVNNDPNATSIQDYIMSKIENNNNYADGYTLLKNPDNEDYKIKLTENFDQTTSAIATIEEDGKVTWDATVYGNASGGSGNGGGSNTPTQEELPANAVATLAKAGTIKRWDKINYNPGNGTTASLNLPLGASIQGKKLASLNLPAGAELTGTISANSATNWVVLDVNETTGEVLIMPKTVSDVELTLEGKDGYNNAIEAINMVASIYKNQAYAESARGLNVEDVNKVMGHTPDGEETTETWNHRYGMNPTTLDITDTGSDLDTPEQTYTSTAETGYYYYSIASLFGSENNCWLASRCVRVQYSDCNFWVRFLYSRHVDYSDFATDLFRVYPDGDTYSSYDSYPVVPVVSLKSNIQIESSETFYTETATGTVSVSEQSEEYPFEHNTWSFQ